NPGSFDMGAYGGPQSDTVPRKIANVTSSPATPAITVSWNPNLSYQVVSYNVYYGFTPDTLTTGQGADQGPSPISVLAGTTTQALTVPAATTPPATPTITSITPKDRALAITWTASPTATSYTVFFRPSPDNRSTPSPPGDSASSRSTTA